MERAGWYLVAYDIANPRRLGRIHRRIRKEGIAAQRSVFFIRGTEGQLNRLLDRLAREIKPTEDDLRAYPVRNPRAVWAFGHNPLATAPLVAPSRAPAPPKPSKPGILGRLAEKWPRPGGRK